MLVGYILSNVCLRLCQFSQLFFMQYTGRVYLTYPFLLWSLWEYMCILSYYHHQIGSMTHLPLFEIRPWNNGMRWMSCYMMATFVEVFINNFRRILLNLAEHTCMANVNSRYCVLWKTPGRFNCWLTVKVTLIIDKGDLRYLIFKKGFRPGSIT